MKKCLRDITRNGDVFFKKGNLYKQLPFNNNTPSCVVFILIDESGNDFNVSFNLNCYFDEFELNDEHFYIVLHNGVKKIAQYSRFGTVQFFNGDTESIDDVEFVNEINL